MFGIRMGEWEGRWMDGWMCCVRVLQTECQGFVLIVYRSGDLG